jgi:4-amino-4-deoxy-L-arabinose transferase-like glycosyltransferase
MQEKDIKLSARRMKNPSNDMEHSSLLPRNPLLQYFLLLLLLITGFSLRLYHISEPPLDFHPTRQYRSANLARYLYYKTFPDTPQWRIDVAQGNKEAILEPPIMELLAVTGYKIAGEENLAIPRSISAFLWVVASLFVYLLIAKMFRPDAGLFGAAYFLFSSYSVSASRSFQPEALMVLMMTIALYALLLHHENPSWRRLVWAGIFSGFAVFVKTPCVFMIAVPYIGLALLREGAWDSSKAGNPFIKAVRKIFNLQTLAYFGLVLLPTLLWFAFGILVLKSRDLQAQSGGSYIPSLLLTGNFWRAWLGILNLVIGLPFLIFSFFGLLGNRKPSAMALIGSGWVGYFLYGLAFTYAIHTHNYYTLPFVIFIALSIGALAGQVLPGITTSKRILPRAIAWVAYTVMIGISISLTTPQLVHPEFSQQVSMMKEIGDAVEHSAHVVTLAPAYGNSLKYNGEISGGFWPYGSDLNASRLRGFPVIPAHERLQTAIADGVRYFIVTDLGEMQRQGDLVQMLSKYSVLTGKQGEYVIFDLSRLASPSN